MLGVTQQAVAKWELTGCVPPHRLKDLARRLRVSVDVLLAPGAGAAAVERSARAMVREFFADQVVVCFEGATYHYAPTSQEAREFWSRLQGGGIVHLSAGPVQALVNVDAGHRIDFSEDPPLNYYQPRPLNSGATRGPLDEYEPASAAASVSNEPEDEEAGEWFERAEARVFLRGLSQPYIGPQTFFDDILEHAEVSDVELVALHEQFEGHRPTQYSIFDLFEGIRFSAQLDESSYDKGAELHPNSLHVFESEDFDGVPQRTWVHTRDIQVIEVPTRLWELYLSSVSAQLRRVERADAKAKQVRKKRGKSRASRPATRRTI
jgi:hypothetical protein